jgi:hypothetical protein
MANQDRDEKELRKREEKSAEEKQFDEKYRRDPLGAIVWPLILIWAGLVLLAANLGALSFILGRDRELWSNGTWSLIFLGAGGIILLVALARLVLPEYRRPITGEIILAIVFLGLGLGNLTNWAIVWPLIIIVIGVSILLRSMFPRR